ncbi:MAG: hypothetical protein GX608_12280 [Lentisphaerae bacterium]|nr:hypothetical protein [Lentisphaerota bacterium]
MTDSKQGELLVGAGQADITPAMGIQIAGDIGRYRPVEQIRDPLYARAVVVKCGGETLAILTADVISITRAFADRIRRGAAEILGTKPEAVLCHATQTHSGPFVGNAMITDDYPLPADLWWLRGGDERYNEPFVRGMLRAVEQAKSSLQPASLKAGRGIDGRVAFNRRYIMRDGTGRDHPGRCDPNILRPEGPADPEVGVAVFSGAGGKAITALLHHTCHPTHGFPHRWISADWPGFWGEGVRGLLGGDCVAPVLNGFCGNILHGNPLDPDHRSNIYLMGERLMETTRRILPDMKPLAAAPLAWDSRLIRIPFRKLPPEDVAKAKAFIEKNPDPLWTDETKTNIKWDWVYAHATLDLARQQQKQSWYDYEVQVLRIGGLAIVGCPGEPFVEGQLDIKLQSPAAHTFVAHMCNDADGYQPTRLAFRYGGYETRVSNWSRLDECALEKASATAREMLGEICKP